MNINTLTVKAQEALQSALSLARERGQQAVEPLHILSVLVREDDSLATFLLGRVGVNVRGLRDEAGRAVASLPRVEGGGDQFFSQDSSKVIQRAVDFTRNFGDKYASVEHLLLGLVAERGQAADILKRSGATEKELLEAHARIADDLKTALDYLSADDPVKREAAHKKLLATRKTLNDNELALVQSHMDRVSRGDFKAIETSALHIALINRFRRLRTKINELAELSF